MTPCTICQNPATPDGFPNLCDDELCAIMWADAGEYASKAANISWPPPGRMICPDCAPLNEPPRKEFHYVRGEAIPNWCLRCDGDGHVYNPNGANK